MLNRLNSIEPDIIQFSMEEPDNKDCGARFQIKSYQKIKKHRIFSKLRKDEHKYNC